MILLNMSLKPYKEKTLIMLILMLKNWALGRVSNFTKAI